MKCAAHAKLTRELGVEGWQATLIRALAKAADSSEALETLIADKCPETHKYARSCFNDPFDSYGWRVTLTLHAVDKVLGTHGVEHLGDVDMHDGPPYLYCNTGDTYALTLVYDRERDSLILSSCHASSL